MGQTPSHSGRPEKSVHAVEQFYATTQGHEVEMIVLSHPDASVESLKNLRFPGLQIHVAECTAIEGWNLAASHATGDFLKVWDDDLFPVAGWLDEAERTWKDAGSPETAYIGLRDCHSEVPRGLFTRAIGTRKFFVDVCGGVITIPHYKSWYDDNEKFDLAKRAKCDLFCKTSIIHHHHPQFGFPSDSTYDIGASRHGGDAETYYRRKAAGFPIDWQPVFSHKATRERDGELTDSAQI